MTIGKIISKSLKSQIIKKFGIENSQVKSKEVISKQEKEVTKELSKLWIHIN